MNSFFLFPAPPRCISNFHASSQLCYGYCQGSLYFGTEFGSECFCGADTDTPEEAPASTNCDMACSGDADETCGGRNALNLYLGDGAIVEGYLGCWTDVTTDRIFGDKLSDATMTIEVRFVSNYYRACSLQIRPCRSVSLYCLSWEKTMKEPDGVDCELKEETLHYIMVCCSAQH